MKIVKRLTIILTVVLLTGGICFATQRLFFTKQDITPEGAVSLDFPLKNGDFVVNYSGPDNSLGIPIHQTPAEKYALDIVRSVSFVEYIKLIKKHGLERNLTFSTPIYSPCDGVVFKVRKDIPDQSPGQRDTGSGNHVIIQCKGLRVVLCHMKQNSAKVSEGQSIRSGDLLGEIGNSGNTDGPHLHIAAVKDDLSLTPTAVPMIFHGVYLRKGEVFKN
jgi:hypothetical protein